MGAQYRKELRQSFCNMTAVTFIALLLILTGIYATVFNFYNGYPNFEITLSNVSFIFFLVVPILTMRSFAEEKGNKTDQLLYSLPVGLTKIVIGKYLAMVTVHAIAVLIMAFYPIFLSFYGEVNLLTSYSALLAFFLLGCVLIAIGMFISSLTESIVLSAVISFGAFILLYLMRALSMLIPTTAMVSLFCFIAVALIIGVIVYLTVKSSTVGLVTSFVLVAGAVTVYLVNSELYENLFPTVLQTLAVFDRMEMFVAYDIFDVSAMIYYVSLICLFVYFTVRSMDKKRWS